MKKTEAKRHLIIEKGADHLLQKGMKHTSLRQFAGAIGVSDRMLLHYFADKEALLKAVLTCLSQRLVTLLESFQGEPLPFPVLLQHLAGMLREPQIRPYLRLWLELTALVAEGEESFRAIAQQIFAHYDQWLTSALKVEREAERRPLAALALATLEGLVLLDALELEGSIREALEGLALLT